MRLLLVLLTLMLAPLAARIAAAEFELKDGDKVVWLGGTFIEREQRYGYWETALTERWPDRKITFRNLGWSGDNVLGEARLAFDLDKPGLGLKRMVDLTLAEKPTVIFVCYGANESFEGQAGLEKFVKGYENLLDALVPAKARIVLMTPPPFEQKGAPLPDMAEANRRLELYRQSIGQIAKKHGLPLADLAGIYPIAPAGSQETCTDNGVTLTEYGYYRTTAPVLSSLGISGPPAMGHFAEGGEASPLRKAIVAKNKLYFYRWRPQNETYLFGFRKHEQGRNAKEVAEFDPLIATAEEEIDRLKKDASTTKSRP